VIEFINIISSREAIIPYIQPNWLLRYQRSGGPLWQLAYILTALMKRSRWATGSGVVDPVVEWPWAMPMPDAEDNGEDDEGLDRV